MRNFKIIPFIFLLSALYFLPSLANADITTGLVGYWNFDEGSGTVVSDFSGKDFSIYRRETLASNGKIHQQMMKTLSKK